MKILNLYAGLGGNRKLWNNVDVTAVEINPNIAKIYGDFFPDDNLIVGDAHKYLIEHYKDGWDFIWSSPPCPTHSQIRYNIGFKADRKYSKVEAKYPDMRLYQEIILLSYWFDGFWVVENTIPYYEPLIEGKIVGGHMFWSNFSIIPFNKGNRNHRGGTVESLQERKQLDISQYDISGKRKLLRNCVEPELGKHILECTEDKKLTDFYW